MGEASWFLLAMAAWALAVVVPGVALTRKARAGAGRRARVVGGALLAAGVVGLAVLTGFFFNVFLRGMRAPWA